MGIELTAEDEEIIAEAQRSDIEEQIGEDGTLEDLYEYLDTIYITPELYDFMTRTMTLYPAHVHRPLRRGGREALRRGDA